MFIETVSKALSDHNVSYAVVGGYAVALHGAVRGTIDVDLALAWNRENLERTITALQSIHLISRLPLDSTTVFTQRAQLIQERNLIAWNFYNPDNLTEQVDLIIDFDITGRSTQQIPIGRSSITVLNKHDLIAMKEKSGRPQDLADIAALKDLP